MSDKKSLKINFRNGDAYCFIYNNSDAKKKIDIYKGQIPRNDFWDQNLIIRKNDYKSGLGVLFYTYRMFDKIILTCNEENEIFLIRMYHSLVDYCKDNCLKLINVSKLKLINASKNRYYLEFILEEN